MLEYIILGFLMHSDMSGYDIKRFMGESTAYFCDASFGSIYPALNRLENSGLVALTKTVENGKFKKLYSLTDAGREHFLEWLDKPIEFRRGSQSFLVNLFFYGFLPVTRSRELIAGYVERMEAEREELKKMKQHIEAMASRFQASTLDYGMDFYEFAIGWCRAFMEQLQRTE